MAAEDYPNRTPYRRLANDNGAITEANPVPSVIVSNGVVSVANSTTTPLDIDGEFTGTAELVTDYATILISCAADASSATDGVELQFSVDGITWKATDNYTYTNGGECKTWANQTVGPYFRIHYTNGGSAQTSFTLCVQYKKFTGVQSAHRVANTVSGQDDAALTKTILMAEQSGGTPDVYSNIAATAGGNLKISVEEGDNEAAPVHTYITSDTSGTIATVEARKQTPTGNALNVQIGPGDVIGNVPVVIEYGHHQIHEGESYSYCNLQTGGLASGSNFDIRISVPALAATTETPHMVFEIVSNGECEAYLHSGVTWTAGGTAVAASANTTAKDNRNHNSINAAQTLLYVNGGTALTVNSTGTIKYIWYLPAAVRTAAGDRSITEIDLAASTEYMLRVTSRAAGLKFLIRLDWYEDLGV